MPLARKYQVSRSLFYHVYNRGNGRQEIFHQEADYRRFMEILVRYSRENAFAVYHWVLMPNHFHLLLKLENPDDLLRLAAGFSRAYVHYHHRRYDSVGHLFQGRFKSQAIEKESYLLACARYIERNPVRAGLAPNAESYAYSSAGYYVLGSKDNLTTTDECFFPPDGDINAQRLSYREYLREARDESSEMFHAFGKALGSAKFQAHLCKKRGIFVPRFGRPLGGKAR
jgi:putative transposase